MMEALLAKMSASDVSATAQACDKLMRDCLKLALECQDPKKCVDFAGLNMLQSRRCTGFVMLFFTKDASCVDGDVVGTLMNMGGELPPMMISMLMRYFPHGFAKSVRLAGGFR